MVHEPTPKELHLAAVALWPASSDWDSRSIAIRDEDASRSESNCSATHVGRRPRIWVAALFAYEDFWRAHGRSPREKTRNASTLPAEERRMGEWARYQRRFDDHLCRYQLLRLGRV
jgi:hypothetical protein